MTQIKETVKRLLDSKRRVIRSLDEVAPYEGQQKFNIYWKDAPNDEVPVEVSYQRLMRMVGERGSSAQEKVRIPPRVAINAMCRYCQGDTKSLGEIRECDAPQCPLYAHRPYRGKSEKWGYATVEELRGMRGYDAISPTRKARLIGGYQNTTQSTNPSPRAFNNLQTAQEAITKERTRKPQPAKEAAI